MPHLFHSTSVLWLFCELSCKSCLLVLSGLHTLYQARCLSSATDFAGLAQLCLYPSHPNRNMAFITTAQHSTRIDGWIDKGLCHVFIILLTSGRERIS